LINYIIGSARLIFDLFIKLISSFINVDNVLYNNKNNYVCIVRFYANAKENNKEKLRGFNNGAILCEFEHKSMTPVNGKRGPYRMCSSWIASEQYS